MNLKQIGEKINIKNAETESNSTKNTQRDFSKRWVFSIIEKRKYQID